MSEKRNVLWIMADQLRFDYLSCYGHPTLHTPHLDALAARGVRFNRAYVQSPFCGPSRASYYTGRYCRSHGATWNAFPVSAGDQTLGDHMRELDVRCALVGKTHMIPDYAGMKRLGIDPDSQIGRYIVECGFEPYERDDGLHPYGFDEARPSFDDFLREHGFGGDNPWEEWANSGVDENGVVRSGWFLKYSNLAARVPDELTETPYMTGRAIDFMKNAGDQNWLAHLSYIKPHWPYIVPEPYHDMYGVKDMLPAVRSNSERQTDHSVFRSYQDSRICKTFASEEVRERVIPAYMGLIKQMDDQLGRLFGWMDENGLMSNTMIVFSSDHGDYLGDHWMGEKDLFHDPSIRTPLIVYDPRPEAEATRGQVSEELVEAIDLAPTFQSYFGGPAKPHIFEGRSLHPLLHGESAGEGGGWREFAFSEYDYSTRPARLDLGMHASDARMVTVMDRRWKYVWFKDHRPVLFDLENDPHELRDLGGDPEYEEVRRRMDAAILEWATRPHARTTMTHEQIDRMAGSEPTGILIGLWDEAEYEETFGHKFEDRPGYSGPSET